MFTYPVNKVSMKHEERETLIKRDLPNCSKGGESGYFKHDLHSNMAGTSLVGSVAGVMS